MIIQALGSRISYGSMGNKLASLVYINEVVYPFRFVVIFLLVSDAPARSVDVIEAR